MSSLKSAAKLVQDSHSVEISLKRRSGQSYFPSYINLTISFNEYKGYSLKSHLIMIDGFE